jgi:hypothetical protein
MMRLVAMGRRMKVSEIFTPKTPQEPSAISHQPSALAARLRRMLLWF